MVKGINSKSICGFNIPSYKSFRRNIGRGGLMICAADYLRYNVIQWKQPSDTVYGAEG